MYKKTGMQKWAGMLVETGKAFVDPSAMMTQMRGIYNTYEKETIRMNTDNKETVRMNTDNKEKVRMNADNKERVRMNTDNEERVE